ncbi:class I SAM-dependent methyltransferase, partial [Halothiobacillus sp. 15-55-196]|uniref:class I SAM-dependent methyltransferase n=1 Tax=Halothiobacillus sp. 15-55-196 TaxID=1970382 RepID=UPI0025B8FFE7
MKLNILINPNSEIKMNQEKLLRAAAFTPQSLEEPNAWVGHLPFAAWLIQEIAPKVFVELGTHTGNSYFSFCQSVKENGLSTKCYAVDTWQGDEHAGYYGDDVFSRVNTHNQALYAGCSRLLRMTFDDAVHYFTDGSIELLHIDGLHTYEAVKHDFETWLPKLAAAAVVLFHDTNVKERGFGVWKLWEELQAIYPNNMEFIHSHGLGVLHLNDGVESNELKWLVPNASEKKTLRDYFAELGARQSDRYELKLNLKPHITNLERALAQTQGELAQTQGELAQTQGELAQTQGELAQTQ